MRAQGVEVTQVDPRDTAIATLQEQVKLLTEFGRRTLEGTLEGPSGAAADIVALEGGNTTISVQLGKS